MNITLAGEQLTNFIERIERLQEEKDGITEDMKEVYASAKAVGYDTAIMRKVVRARKTDAAERQEAETMFDMYMAAVEGTKNG